MAIVNDLLQLIVEITSNYATYVVVAIVLGKINIPAAILLLCAIGGVQGQQCPHNNVELFTHNEVFNASLIVPLCLRCGFIGNVLFPSDIICISCIL